MSEPIRHNESSRNRRKAIHHFEALMEEVQYIDGELTRLHDNFRYAIGRLNRLRNRMKAEIKLMDRM